MITCPICTRQFNQLTNSHLKTHSHTTDTFKLVFPEVSLVSEEVKLKNITNSAIGRDKSTATHKHNVSSRRSEYANNPATCKQCSTPLLYKNRHNTFCSHTCAGIATNATRDYVHSVETKQKIRAGVMKNPGGIYKQHLDNLRIPHLQLPQFNGKILGPYSKVRQCQVCNKTFATTTRNTCSNECYLLTRRGGGFQPNSTIVHRSSYKDQQMDSGAELAFAKLLDAHNVEWQKNSTTFFTFQYPSGKTGKYYPDFYLPVFDAWIEVKGKKYYRDDDPLRWAAVPNHEVIFSHQLRLPAVCTGNAPVL